MTTPTQAKPRPGKLFIEGEWHDAASGEKYPTINPATGDPITDVALAGPEDVDRAVQAARRALQEGPWAKMSAADRGRTLWRIADLIEKNLQEIAEIETIDQGKPIFESSKVDVPFVAEVFRYYAGWATKIHGNTIPVRGPYLNYTLREPVGVCGLIVPWNFPFLLSSWKVAPALAAGCTVILKPAQITPLSALRLAAICEEAGLPPGVLNVVTGKGSVVGQAMVEHPGIAKISLTGSTETGKRLMRDAASTLKHLSLELGGKSPNIVFADADLDMAVRGATNGIFYNKGEVCAAGSRLFLEQGAHDDFMQKLLDRTAKLKQGDPLDPKTRVGPQVSEEHMNKVLGYIGRGKEEGAKLLTGGERASIDGSKGFFVQPTIFDGVSNEMTIAREEIFGPVLSVIGFDDFEKALAGSNDTLYGLASAVWTRDIKKAHRAARALKAGTVWINTYNFFDPASPFGGYKQSGFGRELGEEGIEPYLQTKSVWVDLS